MRERWLGCASELADAARLAEDLKQPAQLWYVAVGEAQLALLEGRFDDAEELVERALDAASELRAGRRRSPTGSRCSACEALRAGWTSSRS